MDDTLLTTAEAGRLIGVTASRIRQFVTEGRLTATRRIRGAILVNRKDVEALVRQPVGYPRGRPRKREEPPDAD